MKCPNCATVNPENAKFCFNCGHALHVTCPHCGTENPGSARFCYHCGTQLQQASAVPARPAPAAVPTPTQPETPVERYMPRELRRKLETARTNRSMEGERRVVTLLFCDVKGSTSMAETLDPEEWAQIMNRIFEYMIAPVYQYEGTIARLMGDSILAFFGAPIAHEDDPQRAVLAALGILDGVRPYRNELQTRLGLDFDVRVGINTGLVVVGEVGSDLRVEYTAMGDAANLAARMEQTAEPGTVQISEQTYRLVKPLFDVEPLGLIEVKGKREPVAAYRVLRPKSQPGRLRGLEGLQSPLVGREEEFARLKDIVDHLASGRGQIISIIGEAGLGKSRLVAEARWHILEHAALAGGDQGSESGIGWYEGRSLSYETSVPYAPFIALLNAVFDFSGDEPDEARYGKVKRFVEQMGAPLVREVAPFVAAMLGLTIGGEDFDRVRYLEPPMLRERIFMAVQMLIEQMASQRPLVLVIDDLHWVDQTSLDLLLRLLPLTGTLPLVILVLFRPNRQDLSWRFHEAGQRDYGHRYQAIELSPLDENATRTLVSNLLYIEGLPENVRQLILQKAEGNPFFVEEVIRSLLDAGLIVREDGHWRATRDIATIAVPDTLVGVITARLDRLDEEAKRTAQTAAVIGREFRRDVLDMVYDEPASLPSALETLEQRELIRDKREGQQRTYAFKHVLTQETAYTSLLLSRRRELHRRVAACLEKLAPDRAGDIARHYLEAQEPELALPYLAEAAKRAARSYSTPEAITLYTQARELIRKIGGTDLARQVYEGLGAALTLAQDLPGALGVYREMLDLGRAREDVEMEISALNKLGEAHALYMGQFPEAMPYLAEAETLARNQQDLRGLAETCNIRCMISTSVADFDAVVRHMSEAITLARTVGGKEEIVNGLDHIAGTMMYMTEFDEGIRVAEEGLQIAREIGNREHEVGFLLAGLAPYYLREGDLDRAREYLVEGIGISEHIGLLYGQIRGPYMLGSIARAQGDLEEALRQYRMAMQAAESIADYLPFMYVFPMAAVGSVYLEISDKYMFQSTELHSKALEMLASPRAMPGGGLAWADIGFCALSIGNVPRAEEVFHKGLTMPTIHMNLQRPRFLMGLAMVALARQQTAEAAAFVEQGRSYAEMRQMRDQYPLIAYTSGLVKEAGKHLEAALEEYQRAVDLGRPMTMRTTMWQAEAAMARVLASLGRANEADAHRGRAQALIAEIASLFKDRTMAEAFAENAGRKLRASGAGGGSTSASSASG